MELEYQIVEGGVLVRAKSVFAKEKSTMILPVSERRLLEIVNRTESIQVAAPELNADQREFLMTGMTPEEWDDGFKKPFKQD